jgi:hypothetical protein
MEYFKVGSIENLQVWVQSLTCSDSITRKIWWIIDYYLLRDSKGGGVDKALVGYFKVMHIPYL